MPGSILVSANLDVAAAGRAAAIFGCKVESVADDIAVQGRIGGGSVDALILEAGFSHIETLLKRLRGTEHGRATLVIVAVEGQQDEATVLGILSGIDDICSRENLGTDLAVRLRPGLSPQPSAAPLVPRRKSLYVDTSGIRKFIYTRLLDMYGFEPITASSVHEGLLKAADVDIVIVDATMERADELPAAVPAPVVALVSSNTAPKGGGFRFAYDRKRTPDELMGVLNELLFGPELPTTLSQRRPMARIARLGAGQDAVWGITEKINPAGMFFRTLAPVSAGQHTTVTLWLPNPEATDGPALEEVSAPVQITWRNPLSTHDTRAEPPGLGLLFEDRVPESLRRFYQTLPKPATRYGALTPVPGSLPSTRARSTTPPFGATTQRLAGLTPPVGTTVGTPSRASTTTPGTGAGAIPVPGRPVTMPPMPVPGRPTTTPTPTAMPVPGRPTTSATPLPTSMPVPGRPSTMPTPVPAARPTTSATPPPTSMPVPGRPSTMPTPAPAGQRARGPTQPGATPSPRSGPDPASLPLGRPRTQPDVTPGPRARTVTPPPPSRPPAPPVPPAVPASEASKPPKKD